MSRGQCKRIHSEPSLYHNFLKWGYRADRFGQVRTFLNLGEFGQVPAEPCPNLTDPDSATPNCGHRFGPSLARVEETRRGGISGPKYTILHIYYILRLWQWQGASPHRGSRTPYTLTHAHNRLCHVERHPIAAIEGSRTHLPDALPHGCLGCLWAA